MNRRNIIAIGLLAALALSVSGIGFVIAQDVAEQELVCNGEFSGLMNGRGFWAQLSEEQRTALADKIQEMLEAGATQEEIREMKASMLQEWGIEAPLWSGPHMGGQGYYGRQARTGSGSGNRFGGCGN